MTYFQAIIIFLFFTQLNIGNLNAQEWCTRCNFICSEQSQPDMNSSYCDINHPPNIIQNGNLTQLPLIDLKILECAKNNCPCNYVPMKQDCSAVYGTSGNNIGMGIDLGKNSKQKLSEMGIDISILDKFDGLYGLNGDNSKVAGLKQRVYMNSSELQQINTKFYSSSINDLEHLFNTRTNSCLTFRKIPVAIRSCFYAIKNAYGDNQPESNLKNMEYLRLNDYVNQLSNVSFWKFNSTLLQWCASIIPDTVKNIYNSQGVDFYNQTDIRQKYCNYEENLVADVVFLIDSSGSIGLNNFTNQILFFIKNVTNQLKIGQNFISVGIAQFGNTAQLILGLDDTFDNNTIIDTINSIKWLMGGTGTHLGLQMVREQIFFNPLRQKRIENNSNYLVQRILFVLTDGYSDEPDLTQKESDLLKQNNVTIFAIGITNLVNQSELENIASLPKNQHTTILDSFNDLQYYVHKVQTDIYLEPEIIIKNQTINEQISQNIIKSYKFYDKLDENNQNKLYIALQVKKGGIILYASFTEKNPDQLAYDYMGVHNYETPQRIYIQLNITENITKKIKENNTTYVQLYFQVVGIEQINDFQFQCQGYINITETQRDILDPNQPYIDIMQRNAANAGLLTGLFVSILIFSLFVFFIYYHHNQRTKLVEYHNSLINRKFINQINYSEIKI